MADLPKNIGWIGLGTMGYPMAGNLLKKLDPTTRFYVYDVSQECIDRFVQDDSSRVHACSSSKEVADKSDIILSMVPEGSHARSVYLDPSTGVICGLLGTKLIIDCSTIDPPTSLSIRATLLATHPAAAFYDCPVSGGALGAHKATLTFMLGIPGTPHTHLDLLTALLSHLGTNLIPCGGPSLGLTAKLCNNYTSALITLATCDAFNIAMASGMDPRVLANVFHTSTAQSAVCDDWNPVPGICPEAPASKGYEGGFRLGLMAKDFGLAVEAAMGVGVGLSLGEVGEGVYRAADGDERCRGLDSRVVYRFLGGREEWVGAFEGVEVGLVRDESRRLLRLGRERDAELRAEAKRRAHWDEGERL